MGSIIKLQEGGKSILSGKPYKVIDQGIANENKVIPSTGGNVNVNKGDYYTVGQRQIEGGKSWNAPPTANKQGCTAEDIKAAKAAGARYLTRAEHKGIPSDGMYFVSPNNINCVYPAGGAQETKVDVRPPIPVTPQPETEKRSAMGYRPFSTKVNINNHGILFNAEGTQGVTNRGESLIAAQQTARINQPAITNAFIRAGFKAGDDEEIEPKRARQIYANLKEAIAKDPSTRTKEMVKIMDSLKKTIMGSAAERTVQGPDPKKLFRGNNETQIIEINKHGGSVLSALRKYQEGSRLEVKDQDSPLSKYSKEITNHDKNYDYALDNDGKWWAKKKGESDYSIDLSRNTLATKRLEEFSKASAGNANTPLSAAEKAEMAKRSKDKEDKNWLNGDQAIDKHLSELNMDAHQKSQIAMRLRETKARFRAQFGHDPSYNDLTPMIENMLTTPGVLTPEKKPTAQKEKVTAYRKDQEQKAWLTGPDAIGQILGDIPGTEYSKYPIRRRITDANKAYRAKFGRDMSYNELIKLVK